MFHLQMIHRMENLFYLGKNNFSPLGCTAFVGLAVQPSPEYLIY